ncbi:MAG: hypothetical protein JKY53_13170 [Flavobacteriales bacterium]|nr:hypothetical protein [Flavobacteriales bacterium]
MKKFKNRFIKYSQSYNSKVFFLLIFSMLCFSMITNLVINEKLKGFTKRAEVRAWMLQNYMDSLIMDSRQILYGLANTLAPQDIHKDNTHIRELLNLFNHDIHSYKSIPFFGFKIYDVNDVVIYHSLIPGHIFQPLKGFSDIRSIESIKDSPFKFIVGPIRVAKVGGARIIPLCIAINNINSMKYSGALCTGLITNKISERLNLTYSTKHHDQITLVDSSLYNEREYQTIDNVFNLKNMFDYTFNNKIFKIYLPLLGQPFFISVNLHFENLIIELVVILLHCLAYFISFLITIYFLFLMCKKQYQEPLDLILEKINQLPNLLDKKHCISRNNNAFIDEPFKILNDIIESYQSAYLKEKKQYNNTTALELHDSILSFISTERKSSPSTYISEIFAKKLESLIHEELIEIDLLTFLTNIKNYSNEQFHKLDTKISLNKKKYNSIHIKSSALNESIISIFSLINNHCRTNEKKVKCILNAFLLMKTLCLI